jgi:hypothetical protein
LARAYSGMLIKTSETTRFLRNSRLFPCSQNLVAAARRARRRMPGDANKNAGFLI